MNPVYKGLKNVKFLMNKDMFQEYHEYDYMNSYGEKVKAVIRVPESLYTYYAIYNQQHNKYIVTNDIMSHGLNGTVVHLEIIGLSDSLDYIMFAIWEHQKEIGDGDNILSHIKAAKKVLNPSTTPNDSEWEEEKQQENNVSSKLKANITVNTDGLKVQYGTKKYNNIGDFLDSSHHRIRFDHYDEDENESQ